MAEQRTVIVHMDAAEQQTMQHLTNHTEWCRAIERLSTWDMSSPTVHIHMDGGTNMVSVYFDDMFPTVNIYKDGDTDMIAVYLNEQGERGYVIGAVWHGDHYGFHS